MAQLTNKAGLCAIAAGTCFAIAAAAVAQPGARTSDDATPSAETDPMGGPMVERERPRDRAGLGRGGRGGGEFAGRGHRQGKRGANLPPELREELRAALDTDGDGQITREERQAGRETAKGIMQRFHAERKAKMLERFDTDGNGSLDDTEREAAKAAFRAKRSAQREAMRARMLERFDADGDGELSRDERVAARETMRERRAERRAEVMERFDTDGDGRLIGDERAAARAAFKQRMTGRKHVGLLDADKSRTIDERELAAGLALVAEGDANADYNGDGVTDQLDAERLIEVFENPRPQR